MPPACRQVGCPVPSGGSCLEGLDPASCPNFIAESAAAALAPDGESATPSIAANALPLPTATPLTVEATADITRSDIARVVVCAGEHDCGKTTLLASLYDSFQDGPLGDLNFAGSATFHGFELRCHMARVESGLEHPATGRTKVGEGFRFLHLRVWDEKTDATTPLLLGDMSGELYRVLMDSTAECQKYGFLRRADHFVALLDGKRIKEGFHAEAFGHTHALIRALLDAGALAQHAMLTLLTTKWDLLAGSDEHESLVAGLEKRFSEAFAPRVRRVSSARVAARPDVGDRPVGLAELLADWVGHSNALPIRSSSTPEPGRAFDLYATARRAATPWKGTW
jgi:hypothetical protein